MPRRLALALIASLALAAGLVLAACGDDDDDGGGEVSGVQAVDKDSCGDVQYSGSGEPDKLIVADHPLQGDSAERSKQQNDAIVQEIARRGWQAGKDIQVAFQACDDTLASTGEWDEALCRENAQAYVDNPDVIGVIGTYNSGCAAEEIPILNKGGLAMLSDGNTLVCLTEPASTCEPGQPDSLYPTGKRNYARVVPNDAVQGAGMAKFAFDQGVRKPFILIAADDATSEGQGRTFEGAGRALGMEIAGVEHYDPEATSYTKFMQQAKSSGADAVFLGAILELGGKQLIKDKVAVLGPNDGDVKLLAPDGFDQQSTIDQAGADAAGMFASAPGKEPSTLTGSGAVFVQQLQAQIGDAPIETFAPYSGEAAEVMLDAIAKGKDRAGTIAAIFETNLEDGIIGDISITPTGDPTPPPISISKAGSTFDLEKTVVPPPDLISAARGK